MDLLKQYCETMELSYTIETPSSIVIETDNVVKLCMRLATFITENGKDQFETNSLLSALENFNVISFTNYRFFIKFYMIE